LRISRRAFLKYCAASAAALGLTNSGLLKLEDALAKQGGLTFIWLNGQSCTGCTVSFANSVYYATIQDLLLYGATSDSIDLLAIETLSASMGDQFLPPLPVSDFVLAVEGSIPTENPGYCEIANTISGSGLASPVTIYDAVTYYAGSSNCTGVLSIGTCASYGGIPAARGNMTGAKGIYDAVPSAIKSKVVNIPGCPPNPNWIVGSIAYILANGVSALATRLDNIRRPKLYFSCRLCRNCYRLDAASDLTSVPGRKGLFVGGTRQYDEIGDPNKRTWCLRKIGCKGTQTQSDCSYREWHSSAYSELGVNWCVGAGAPCQGCTQSNFPDKLSPFFGIQ